MFGRRTGHFRRRLQVPSADSAPDHRSGAYWESTAPRAVERPHGPHTGEDLRRADTFVFFTISSDSALSKTALTARSSDFTAERISLRSFHVWAAFANAAAHGSGVKGGNAMRTPPNIRDKYCRWMGLRVP